MPLGILLYQVILHLTLLRQGLTRPQVWQLCLGGLANQFLESACLHPTAGITAPMTRPSLYVCACIWIRVLAYVVNSGSAGVPVSKDSGQKMTPIVIWVHTHIPGLHSRDGSRKTANFKASWGYIVRLFLNKQKYSWERVGSRAVASWWSMCSVFET